MSTTHPVVSESEWLAARQELLAKEKAFTRARDELSRERQRLPWTKVEKEYVFDGPDGKQTLAELFDGRSQLIVYHFMYAPGDEAGCPGCSFLADGIDSANLHLAHHDVTLLCVSRAPWQEFQAYKKRMRWHFKWVSSAPGDFNYDYHVSFRAGEKSEYNFKPRERTDEGEGPGLSTFFKDTDGTVYHCYSGYERAGDILIDTYNWLDHAPLGRNEDEIMGWMQRHDEYGDQR